MTARLASGPVRSRKLLLGADGAAAIALSVLAALYLPDHLSTSSTLLGGVASIVAATTVAWRRLAPFAACVVAISATVACQRVTHQGLSDVPPFPLILDTYTAGLAAVARRQGGRLIVLVAFLMAGLTVLASETDHFVGSVIVKAALPVIVAPVIAGAFVAWRRTLTHELELTRALLEDEQELLVALAAVNERNRLALELHDVVTHGVSVMVIQAGAARVLFAEDPTAVQTRLERITGVGREAIDDLRQLVGPVGTDRDSAEPEVGGWGHLHALGRRMSDVGLRTEVAIDGDRVIVGEEVRQIIYRVAQEALTNAVRHSGTGTAALSLRLNDDFAEVQILSRGDGAQHEPVESDSGGRGLVGMSERVHRQGGEARIGELPDGSFEVWARLPLPSAHARGPWRLRPGLIKAWQASPMGRRIGFAALTLVVLELDAVFSALRRGPLVANCAIVGAMAVATLWRHRWPLAVCLAITALAVPLSGGVADMSEATIVSTFIFVVPIYSVAAWSDVGNALAGLCAVVVATLGVGAWRGVGVAVVADNCVLTVGLWMVGRLIRVQRRISADLTAASAELMAERADRERQMAEMERARVLQELRASVLRDITSMVALAETMQSSAGSSQPGDEVETLRAIEATGRSALTNLREILGALRPAAAAEVPPSLRTVPA